MQPTKSIFNEFTNKYSLSKTLRFELKPVGKTRENMNKNLGYLEGKENDFSTFLKDQEIEDSYQVLKPIFDTLHEEFITNSLETIEAKSLYFNEYFDIYKKYIFEKDKEKKIKLEKSLDVIEKNIRKKFASIYEAEGNNIKKKVGKNEKDKDILTQKSYKVLTEANILKYIKNNINYFVNLKLQKRDGKDITKADLEKALGTTDAKGVFEGFFTYFTGFNQNRENYYATDEKATAVATRIVNENLPKFCDNSIAFENRKTEYLQVYDFLKNKENALKGKNKKSEEKNIEPIIQDIFSIEHFNHCLSQKEIEEYNSKIGDANFLINLYNQKQENKANKLKLFKTLYKQIGCGDKNEFIQQIQNFEELQNILKTISLDSKDYFKKIDNFCNYVKDHETFENIYWSDKAINTISSKYFANWYTLKADIWGKRDKKGNLKEEDIKIPQAIQLKDLFEELNKKEDWKEKGIIFKESLFEENSDKYKIIQKFEQPHKALLAMIFFDISEKRQSFESLTDKILQIADTTQNDNKPYIKEWLDSLLYINQIIKYWKVKDKFSTESDLTQKLDDILFPEKENNPTRFYDSIRNYVTKKPQGEINKLKLNFQNSSLAAGWDVNKISENYSVILKDKENQKYLAIIHKNNKNFFQSKIKEGKGKNKVEKENPLFKTQDSILWKMEYKQIAAPTGIGGFVRKCFKTAQQYGWTCPNDCLNSEGKIIIKNDEVKNLPKLIDCYKDFFAKYEKDGFKYKNYNFIFKESNKYEKLNDFFSEVENQGYKIEWEKINKNILDEAVENGELYLFQIKNKDNNIKNGKQKISKKNLHSIYWDSIFTNQENKPKLLGNAEIFYRPANFKIKKVVKEGYENKKDNNGDNYIIENKRFTEEKFLFHCPIKLNYKEKSYSKPQYAIKEINDEINSKVSKNKELCFLGIDRGEKHLAYYSLVDQNGNILEQNSFNEINGQNYAEKLEKIAKDRDDARKNWETIGTIKELKDGYISQIVRKIVDLAIENNAFIVLENLNVGFKRGRQKIEKQVYQKLELALAKKLNFLVDKHAKDGEIGSVTNALQLTPPVTNFGDIEGRSQLGIMLYIKADYTSQTDPVTGWRKSIYLKKLKKESEIKEQIIEAFDDFGFDGTDYYFTYTDKNTNKIWTLYSGKNGKSIDRYYRKLVHENSEKKWIPQKQDIVDRLNTIFADVDFTKNSSAKNQILDGDGVTLQKYEKKDQSAWESLRFTIDLIQQIRNTGISAEDEDFILSPVRNEDGKKGDHFDSRKANKNLPNSGDANGAYNIARKGIIMNEHIKNGWKSFISDDEWSAWLAGKQTWNEWIKKNEKSIKNKKV